MHGKKEKILSKQDRILFEKKAEILKALAHPLRLAIVSYLKAGPQCVCDIAEHIGSERSNVSRHLSVMTKAGVLDHEKDGLNVLYSLRTPCVLGFLDCVSQCLIEQAKENQNLLKSL